MVWHVEGEKAAWDGGVLTPDRWLALHNGYAASAANEFQVDNDAADNYAGNYVRVRLRLADWAISNATGAASNAVALRFAAPPAGEEWPGALSLAIWDAADGGNILVDENIVGAALVGTPANPAEIKTGQLIFDV